MSKPGESEGRAPEDVPKRRPPARTRTRRVSQLVELAEDLVEERLRTGKASPTEVTAVLRYGSMSELANVERIKAQTEYLVAQKAKAEAETVLDEKMQRAIDAFTSYDGARYDTEL